MKKGQREERKHDQNHFSTVTRDRHLEEYAAGDILEFRPIAISRVKLNGIV